MKSQKGSVTVIALIMLLFLVILCGGWIVMMTQEKTNAFADEKQQQAWYAAEAGYKRAAMLINSGNSNWDKVSTSYADIKSNKESTFTKLAMDLGTVPAQGPWYAFSISNGTDDLTSAAVDNTTYTITSVGEYMGERKVISRTYKKTASGGGGGGSGDLFGPGLIQSEKKVTIQSSVNTLTGDIYVTKKPNENKKSNNYFEDQRWDHAGYANVSSTAVNALKTKVPEKYFKQNNYDLTTVDYVTKVAGYDAANKSPLQIADGEQKYVNWPIQAVDYWNPGKPQYNNWNVGIEGGVNSLLFIHVSQSSPTVTVNYIKGPTTGKPLTIIFDGDVTLQAIISGNVRILSKGKITIDKYGDMFNTLLFVVANGDIVYRPPTKVAALSSNGNITIESSANTFYGQVIAKGNVTIGSDTAVYDNSVANSGLFSYPDGMQ